VGSFSLAVVTCLVSFCFLTPLMGNTTEQAHIKSQHWLLEQSNKGCTCSRCTSLTKLTVGDDAVQK